MVYGIVNIGLHHLISSLEVHVHWLWSQVHIVLRTNDDVTIKYDVLAILVFTIVNLRVLDLKLREDKKHIVAAAASME